MYYMTTVPYPSILGRYYGGSSDHPSTTQDRCECEGKRARWFFSSFRREPTQCSCRKRIQHYTILPSTLGRGSMGKVKLAECSVNGNRVKVAVKIMRRMEDTNPDPSSGDPKNAPAERERRTRQEMTILQLLQHPHICQLKEWIAEDTQYYMFLEYVDGGHLLNYVLRHGRLREKQARKFARQIISALDYCHQHGIAHRDLKMENILVTRHGDIKIIDFGLSSMYAPGQLLSTFCGSLYFAAPELLCAQPYCGAEVDVWSFGVVIYVLVCGRVPFDDKSIPALHNKIKTGDMRAFPGDLSHECMELLQHILVVDPAKRMTLAAIKNHPWITRGYSEPIQSHIPARPRLDTVRAEVVQTMGDLGFGTTADLTKRLMTVLASHDQSQGVPENRPPVTTPWWQRTWQQRQRQPSSHTDAIDPKPLCDPILSLYHLVDESMATANLSMQKNRTPSSLASNAIIPGRSSVLSTPPNTTSTPMSYSQALCTSSMMEDESSLPKTPQESISSSSSAVSSTRLPTSNRKRISLDAFLPLSRAFSFRSSGHSHHLKQLSWWSRQSTSLASGSQ